MNLPSSLAGNTATGIHKDVAVAQWELGPARNLVYLLLDWDTRQAAWVDPQSNLTPVVEALKAHGFTLQHVLLTHTHHDHVAGLEDVLRMFPEVPAHCHALDRHRLHLEPTLQQRIHPVAEGDVLPLGNLRVTVLHTPGHSAGECCFQLNTTPPLLCTGDTLFVGDCGRCDLESGSVAEMFASLQRLKLLAANTIILPGHHYAVPVATTLAHELEHSGPLRAGSVAALGALP